MDDDSAVPPYERAAEEILESIRRADALKWAYITGGYRFAFRVDSPLTEDEVRSIHAAISKAGLRAGPVHQRASRPVRVSVNAYRRAA